MINQWVSEQQGYKGELAQDWYNKIFVPTYQDTQSRKDKEQHFIQSQTNIFHYQNHFMPQYTIENTSPFSNTGGIKYGTQYQVQEFNTGRMNLGKPTINWGGFDWSKNQMKGFGGK